MRRWQMRSAQAQREGEGRRVRKRGQPFVSRASCLCQAEDGIRGLSVTGVQTCALPISAGCLHIDDDLMNEFSMIKEELPPSEMLLIADSMIGQDAVRSAGEFHTRLGLTGVILSKLDGDARGGAALSIGKVTGAPVKFVGLGEKYDALEGFYPERIVSRGLGMGDIMSLIERVEQTVDRKAAADLERKLRKEEFTLED